MTAKSNEEEMVEHGSTNKNQNQHPEESNSVMSKNIDEVKQASAHGGKNASKINMSNVTIKKTMAESQ